MDWTAKNGVAPQTWFGTTHAYDMAHDGPMPAHLGLHPEDLSKKRHGNYRNGEFYASRLAIRRRSVDFYRQAYDTVVRDAKCADVYNGAKTRLPKPFEGYSDGSDCPQPRRYGGSGRIEGYWSAFFCEPCAMPRRGEDPRLPFCYGGSKCADSMR